MESPVSLNPRPPGPYNPSPYYGYQPVPSYYPPWYAAPTPAGRSDATAAAVMFSLASARDFFMILFVIADGPFLMTWASLPFGDYWVLALFPLVGMLASAYCAARATKPRDRERTAVLVGVAVVGSSFPGIVIVGPAGIILSVLGAFLYLKSQRAVRRAEAAGFHTAPQNA